MRWKKRDCTGVCVLRVLLRSKSFLTAYSDTLSAVQTLCFISSSSSEGSLHINDEATPPPMHGRDTKLGSRRYRDDNVWKEYKDGEYGRKTDPF